MLNERTYPTPDSGLTHLFSRSLHCVGLVTPECTHVVIDPLYHSRHNDRDRQYERDRVIIVVKCKYVWMCRKTVEVLASDVKLTELESV